MRVISNRLHYTNLDRRKYSIRVQAELLRLKYIVGAAIGTLIGQALGFYAPNEPAGFIGAVIGAIILLALLKAVSAKK